jgi:glycosyltransferase involved in cell wall biosynthesis
MTGRLGDPLFAYMRARDAVLRMKQAAPGGAPSAYWAEELANIDYLADASPLIVNKLRHHSFHVTGIRPYDYRIKADGRRQFFEQRLAALRALGGDALLVPEHPALGGFGYEIDGRLFNVDTLKFYEVLIGMERAGVLPALRGSERPVVCEVGAGWGGFAYQFKTLFPRSTYVIVDFAELFLFSATYLATLFPDARLHFVGDDRDAGGEWRTADFVFVPHTRANLLPALPLELTLNMVSFQEMTESQVRAYARIAADAACPRFYSFNRTRSPYNDELTSVAAALGDDYALREIDVLGTDYTTAMKRPPAPARMGEKAPLAYRHLAGTLRRTAGPRVVLGMTLHNNAAHLPEAVESILAQTHPDFVLVMLDDASTDDVGALARVYAARDPRVRYHRRAERQGMIATWREVVEIAARECPSADLFAWVSDHDRWHPRWLSLLVAEMNAAAGAVLVYPQTRRLTAVGEEIEKAPRLFDTAGLTDVRTRWRHFCRGGIGAGDMVYGLMRIEALRAAGVFRAVLRPDRLLVAELVLRGEIRQVPEVLWFRRNVGAASVTRQRHTLVAAGAEPSWFWWPPWLQHARVFRRDYDAGTLAALGITAAEWRNMVFRYQATYGWRHARKSETSYVLGRGIDRLVLARKMLKHHYHHAVYRTLVAMHAFWNRVRRAGRQA